MKKFGNFVKGGKAMRLAPVVCGVLLVFTHGGVMAAPQEATYGNCTFQWNTGEGNSKIDILGSSPETRDDCAAQLGGTGTSAGWNLTTNGGLEDPDKAVKILAGDTVDLSAGTNIEITKETTKNTDTGVSTTTVTVGTKPDLEANSLTIKPIEGAEFSGIDMGTTKITNLKAGEADTDAVNVGQLNAVKGDLITKGMDFAANENGPVHRDLGERLTIRGDATSPGEYTGANLKTKVELDQDGAPTGTIILQMTDQPKFGNVAINDGGSGRITGVAKGEVSPTSEDAINGSQLYQTNQAINNLSLRYDELDKEARAGTASAMAVAGLPQAYLPGKSMVAMSGATYRGATGVALGVSTITDNGKWVFKGAVNSNNKGHVGATLGAGYQW